MLEDEELSGGDFVRNVKQLIDLLRGIGDAAPEAATAARARQAAEALQRGVVTATIDLVARYSDNLTGARQIGRRLLGSAVSCRTVPWDTC